MRYALPLNDEVRPQDFCLGPLRTRQIYGPYIPLDPAKRYTAHFQIRASAVARVNVLWLREGDFVPFGETSVQVDTTFKDFRWDGGRLWMYMGLARARTAAALGCSAGQSSSGFLLGACYANSARARRGPREQHTGGEGCNKNGQHVSCISEAPPGAAQPGELHCNILGTCLF